MDVALECARCTQCEYDLRGLDRTSAQSCPECGLSLDASTAAALLRFSPVRTRRLIRFAAIWMLAWLYVGVGQSVLIELFDQFSGGAREFLYPGSMGVALLVISAAAMLVALRDDIDREVGLVLWMLRTVALISVGSALIYVPWRLRYLASNQLGTPPNAYLFYIYLFSFAAVMFLAMRRFARLANANGSPRVALHARLLSWLMLLLGAALSVISMITDGEVWKVPGVAPLSEWGNYVIYAWTSLLCATMFWIELRNRAMYRAIIARV